jgi:hypothetical protein
MSDIVWSIDPRRDDLASLIARVRRFALDLAEPKGITLELRTPPGAEKVKLAPEQRRHLYLLLKEAVNNVAKHAGCRNLGISLTHEGSRLRTEVKDDGTGFAGSPACGVRRPRSHEHAVPGGADGRDTGGPLLPGRGHASQPDHSAAWRRRMIMLCLAREGRGKL